MRLDINIDELAAMQHVASKETAAQAVAHWNAVGKPIGSLGLLEDLVVKIAALTGSTQVRVNKRAVIAMCADNGVVAEGVTQTGAEVTAIVAGNMAKSASSVCKMGALAGAQVFPVDVGVLTPVPGTINRRIAAGTANMTQGPAMTREQALTALLMGVDMVESLAGEGFDIFALGEMGIGNTTTSSAVASVLLGRPVEEMTGKGSGLTSDGLARKVDAIKRAVALNKPNPEDALDVVAKVGGLDIAGLAGVCIGGVLARKPIIVDGFISAVAALVAQRLCPAVADVLLASHVSAEPASHYVLDELGLCAPIHAGMRLGEGTGAVCLLPLLDMALEVYNGLSFDEIGVETYDASLV